MANTPFDLSRFIFYNLGRVPEERHEELRHRHPDAWAIVDLVIKGLVHVTAEGYDRLEDFRDAVRRLTPDGKMLDPS